MSGIVADFVQDEKGRIDFELVRMNRKTLSIHIGAVSYTHLVPAHLIAFIEK